MLVNFNNTPSDRMYFLPLTDCSPCCINVICHQFYFSGVICWIIAEQLKCHVIHHFYIHLPLSYFFWKLLGKKKIKKNKPQIILKELHTYYDHYNRKWVSCTTNIKNKTRTSSGLTAKVRFFFFYLLLLFRSKTAGLLLISEGIKHQKYCMSNKTWQLILINVSRLIVLFLDLNIWMHY